MSIQNSQRKPLTIENPRTHLRQIHAIFVWPVHTKAHHSESDGDLATANGLAQCIAGDLIDRCEHLLLLDLVNLVRIADPAEHG